MPLDAITQELIDDVTNTLVRYLTDGFERYPEQRWLGQSCNVHLKHAKAHILYMTEDDDTSKRPENDYANALMRIAMAQYVKTHYVAPIGNVPAEWSTSGPLIKLSSNWMSKEKP